MAKFSVLMSVYANDDPAHLKTAFDSILNQTLVPSQVIIVEDGPLTDDAMMVIDKFKQGTLFEITIIKNEVNLGLGASLAKGVMASEYEIIVRADADDISVSNRFEKLINYFENNEDVDIVGSNIAEFEDDPKIITGKRVVPTEHKDIVKFAKFRSPLNHPAVALKKTSILEVGNYSDVRNLEDYDLWLRAIAANLTMHNLSDNLVLMRTGNGMYSRRGGTKYFKSYEKIKRNAYHAGILSIFEYIASVSIIGINIAIPTSLREVVYKRILHKEGR